MIKIIDEGPWDNQHADIGAAGKEPRHEIGFFVCGQVQVIYRSDADQGDGQAGEYHADKEFWIRLFHSEEGPALPFDHFPENMSDEDTSERGNAHDFDVLIRYILLEGRRAQHD